MKKLGIIFFYLILSVVAFESRIYSMTDEKLIEKDAWVNLMNLCNADTEKEKEVQAIIKAMEKKIPTKLKQFLNQNLSYDDKVPEWLEQTGPKSYRYKDIASYTALNAALNKNYKNIAQILLDAGADINQGNHFKRTALMLVAVKGDKALMEWLFIRGAEVNQVDYMFGTPLMYSTDAGYQDIALWLIKDKKADIYLTVSNARDNILSIAVHKGLLKLINYLLNEAKNPEKLADFKSYPFFKTVLHRAVLSPNDKIKEVIQKLLDYFEKQRFKGDKPAFEKFVNTKDVNGETALDFLQKRKAKLTTKAEQDIVDEVEKMFVGAGAVEKSPLQESLMKLKQILEKLIWKMKTLKAS